MLYGRWKALPDPHKLVIGVGVTTLLLAVLWFMGALANPLPMSPVHLAKVAPANPPVSQAAIVVPPQIFEKVTPQQAVLMNANVAISSLPNPAAKPFKLPTINSTDRAWALTCLTMAVYYEAASQSDQGEAAVAQVVLNRLRNPLFPKTVCGVVFQGSTLPTGCQFTFTCDGSLNRRPSLAGWQRANQIAQRALNGYVEKSVGDATHYHTVWVVPYWQASLVKVAQIGAHIFYRWSGGLGAPAAFQGQYAGVELAPPQIKGFDSGLNVPVVAAIAAQDAQTPAVADTPAAPSAPSFQVAALTPPAPVQASAVEVVPVAVKPRGFFGGGQATGQHLAIASRW